MLTFLAKDTSAGSALMDQVRNLFDTVVAVFSRGDALASENLVGDLKNLGAIWAIVFLIVGVLCMLNGYKFYRVATIAVAGAIGMFGGYWIAQHINTPPLIVAGALGLLMAVIAFPLMKYAVAVFGGLTGAFVGANLWSGAAYALNTASGETVMPESAYWVGALVGLIICGMLAFVLFKLSIVLFTAVSGSTLAVLGGLALLLSFEPWEQTVSEGLSASKLVIPLLVFVPAMIGLILQEKWTYGDTPADAPGAS